MDRNQGSVVNIALAIGNHDGIVGSSGKSLLRSPLVGTIVLSPGYQMTIS